MNRLFILGNGFDKAHGLPTSYSEFLAHYIKQCIHSASTQGARSYFDDDVLSLELSKFMRQEYMNEIDNCSNLKDLRQVFGNMTKQVSIGKPTIINLNWKNKFLERIYLTSKDLLWVDIEQAYFERYLIGYDKYKKSPYDRILKNFVREIVTLNSEISNVKSLLGEYLLKNIQNIITEDNLDTKPFDLLFSKKILMNDYLPGVLSAKKDEEPAYTMFLNFNYTPLISRYIKPNEKVSINNIHGELGSDSNPMVFGYGDELEENFQGIENLNENLLLENFKSYSYHETTNYRDMLSFLENGPFEVNLIGHSCGISDRTLLSYMFQHENCKLIKPYHYGGKDGYRQLVMNISRHFTDKSLQRSRVLPFDPANECPQVEFF